MVLVILAIVSILDCDQFENYIGTGNLLKGNPTEWSDGLSVPVSHKSWGHDQSLSPNDWSHHKAINIDFYYDLRIRMQTKGWYLSRPLQK